MSLSVGNGGIGQSPAISRINRLSPEKESDAIAYKMRQVVQPVETRAKSIGNENRLGLEKLWTPSIPAGIKPFYPDVRLNIQPLSKRVEMLTKAAPIRK